MEPLQKQFTTLSQKVDALYQIVDLLNGQVADALSECRLTPMQDRNGNLLVIENTERYPSLGYSNHQPAIEHKDVLADNSSKDTHKLGEKELTRNSNPQADSPTNRRLQPNCYFRRTNTCSKNPLKNMALLNW